MLFWHFHKTPRVYFDVVVQLADDAGFKKNVRTIFNNDNDNTSGLGAGQDMNYVETAEGKLVDAKGARARYVRLYSKGNNANELNHYVEVEVWGVRRSRPVRTRRGRMARRQEGRGRARRRSPPRRSPSPRGRAGRSTGGTSCSACRRCRRWGSSATPGASSAATSRSRQRQAEAARPAPPKDLKEVNVALLGAGAQGQVLLDAMLRIPGLRFRAVCDIWTEYNQKRAVNTLRKFKYDVPGYEDYREMLDKEKELDAVVIATPDFWHAPHTIDCLKAGKNVYCEKEMSNTLEGARAMVSPPARPGSSPDRPPAPQPSALPLREGEPARRGEAPRPRRDRQRPVEPRGVARPRVAQALRDPRRAAQAVRLQDMPQFRNWRWYKGKGGGPIVDLGSHQIDIYNWFLDATPRT